MYKKAMNLLFIGLTVACMAVASEGERKASEDKREISEFEISEKTAIIIKRIDQDAEYLCDYFEGVFQKLEEQNLWVNPSRLLRGLSSTELEENAALNKLLRHMSVQGYIDGVIVSSFEKLDETFGKMLTFRKDDVRSTWPWFSRFFARYGLIDSLTAYKKQLIEADQKRRRMQLCQEANQGSSRATRVVQLVKVGSLERIVLQGKSAS